MLSTEEAHIENAPVSQSGGGKKTILTQRQTHKIVTSHNKNIMKKQIKMDPTQMSNMIPPTSKNKRLKSACAKADDVWNVLANDNTEPRIHQPEYIWTNQEYNYFCSPRPRNTNYHDIGAART